ncbi:transketolase [Halanaerobium saccharolyticum]|uniref:Transketolase n=1 Tax=Halanaerobium saccharolyticum TaxID=43595 RepID=A0A4R7Z6A3_9FIRM|nr:transketolase [Halanaerobium saccharolyticum]RAK09379.1 transketolase [Halanaerobium saccharolyticum]TDW06238.1 transketolase [Halanaerobium saccharolyticum]TDX61032.1 transketolase [Halanaerobium saccharolyticum]
MLKEVANTVRGLAADIVEKANSGHPGMPIGCADIGALLFGEVMNLDASKSDWPNRDRFVLSAGHGSAFLYSFLHLKGYDISMDDLKEFRQLHSNTPGHPEKGDTDGVETTTGPLGQGFGNAIGMALAEKMLAEKYNTEEHKIVDHYTYTIMGDGCMMEGVTSEAASLAGHLGLDKLIAIYDDNNISIAGNTNLAFTESVADRFRAFGWQVIENVDGHNIEKVREAINQAKSDKDRPTVIMAKTHIALGAPNKQDTADAHGAPLGEDEIRGLKEKFNLPVDEKFYVSDEVKEFFRSRAAEMQDQRLEWEKEFEAWAKANPGLKKEWDQAMELKLPVDLKEEIMDLEIEAPIASRKSAGAALSKAFELVPYLVGGSADLAPSTKTYNGEYGEVQKGDYSGRNFRFGVREHAMGAITNGLSLHQGLRPFVATFLVFSDYMRPSIRLAAIMREPVIYVFTHDSIFVGEDGPTHQPVEHVEALRIIPGLKVLRPGDEEEAKAAWVEALETTDQPTALILTRQNLEHIEKYQGLDKFNNGGYFVSDPENADTIIFASGSEVNLAEESAKLLAEKGIKAAVMSVPERRKLEKYAAEHDLPEVKLRVAIEAGVTDGWYRIVGRDGLVIGLDRFGLSGKGQEVGEELGFKAEKVVEKIEAALK